MMFRIIIFNYLYLFFKFLFFCYFEGAHLVQNTEVTKLDLKENGTWDIQTSQGALNAGLVINAAGFLGQRSW